MIVTFNHEPQTDLHLGSPAEFAAAWTRIHDVWDSESGLRNVAFAPISNEWVFNPVNQTEHPAQYSSRLDRVIGFLDSQGYRGKTVGVGIG